MTDLNDPRTYEDLMMELDDCYSDICPMPSSLEREFMLYTYLMLKQLMADVQTMQKQLDENIICQCNPSVN